LGPNGKGTVTGVDISKHRLYTAKSIIQKYKLDRARLFLADGKSFATPPPSRIGPLLISNQDTSKSTVSFVKPFFANRLIRSDPQTVFTLYDKVLVDAECTHDGSIVRPFLFLQLANLQTLFHLI
jgi:16S rRNA C967 or C1407 C5-methylase (RsmB/RsmF family)